MKRKKRLRWQLSGKKNLNFENGNEGNFVGHLFWLCCGCGNTTQRYLVDLPVGLLGQVWTSLFFFFSSSSLFFFFFFNGNKNFSNYGNSACI